MTVKEQVKAFIKLAIILLLFIVASFGVASFIDYSAKKDKENKAYQFANQQAMDRVELLLHQNLLEQKALLRKYDSLSQLANPKAPKKLPTRIY